MIHAKLLRNPINLKSLKLSNSLKYEISIVFRIQTLLNLVIVFWILYSGFEIYAVATLGGLP